MNLRKWKTIREYPNYKVSDDGQVINSKGKALKPFESEKGYYCVTLYHKGKRRKLKIHRLVALHFLPLARRRKIVNHKNADKKDNRVSNLEWTTVKQNTRHAWKNGLCESCREAARNTIIQYNLSRD